MTLEELYALIGCDYEQATKIMRKEKLIDRYVRKFVDNELRDTLMAAGEQMDATGLYESAHALKGVCANLGFVDLASAASDITEEFRLGNERKFSDAEVAERLAKLNERYDEVVEGIRQYINS